MSHTMKIWEREVTIRKSYIVSVNVDKAYDSRLREELRFCMRASGVGKEYVRLVPDMYENSGALWE